MRHFHVEKAKGDTYLEYLSLHEKFPNVQVSTVATIKTNAERTMLRDIPMQACSANTCLSIWQWCFSSSTTAAVQQHLAMIFQQHTHMQPQFYGIPPHRLQVLGCCGLVNRSVSATSAAASPANCNRSFLWPMNSWLTGRSRPWSLSHSASLKTFPALSYSTAAWHFQRQAWLRSASADTSSSWSWHHHTSRKAH